MSVGAFLVGSLDDRISDQRFLNRASNGASITFLSRPLVFLLSLRRRAASTNTVETVKY